MELRSGQPFFLLVFSGWLSAQIASHTAPIDTPSEVPSLIQTLSATNQPFAARVAAVQSLERLGARSALAGASLVDVLIDKSEATELRLATISALRDIPLDERAIPALVVVLRDKKEIVEIRQAAFNGYWKLASNSTVFINHFARLLQDNTEPDVIREQAAKVLRGAATSFANNVLSRPGNRREMESSISQLHTVRAAFQSRGITPPVEVTRASAALEKKLELLIDERPLATRLFSTPWRWLVLPLLPPVVCLPCWLLLVWRSPLTLWKMNRALEVLVAAKIVPTIDLSIALRNYLLLSLFRFHPRVLDAWLLRIRSDVKNGFIAQCTVADRSLHIPIPARINRLAVERPAPGNFRELFRKPRTWITICGEAGSGKTSLACQLALWAMAERAEDRLADHWMMPVLVSHDSDLQSSPGMNPLVEAIAKGVRIWCDDTKAFSGDLLHHLLKEKRILVIVDGVEEGTQGASRWLESARDAQSPINALVVTSRFRETLAAAEPSVVEPCCLDEEAIPQFVGAILKQQGKRGLLDPREILDDCLRFIDGLNGQAITPLLARMFTEQLIGSKASGRRKAAPANVPDLVLSFIGELNRRVPSQERMADPAVFRLASAAGWKCLDKAFRASAVRRDELEGALERDGWTKSDFAYLEKKIGLLWQTDETSSRLHFRIGVLAEYLAALHAIEEFNTQAQAWRQLLDELSGKPENRTTARSFIRALRECCIVKAENYHVPDFVEHELGRLEGLDPALLERLRLERRTGRLIRKLSHPIPNERETAVLHLAEIGPSASAALPVLCSNLRNSQEAETVRCAIVKAIEVIGGDNGLVIDTLVACLRDNRGELSSLPARALARLGAKSITALMKVIDDRQASEEFKIAAVSALGSFELDGEAAVPILVQALKDQRESPRVREGAAEALGRIRSHAEAVVPDLIDAMRQNKSLCQSAAKALISIAPTARSTVIALVEALNPSMAQSSKEILAALRQSLIQPEHRNPPPALAEPTERICRALRDALSKVQRQHESMPPQNPNRGISLAS